MTPPDGLVPAFETLVAALWAKACPLGRAEVARAVHGETLASPVAQEALFILASLDRASC